ncbi:MAG: tRNA (adenosine(37)-N6)-threonylcarbamoyltransferase complex dimerization subunit type 1 TsaB [Ginsengibacter sp.]
MIWMLLIHTALPRAIVALSNGDEAAHFLINDEQREHTAFLHVAIDELLKKADIKPGDIKVVGVSSGPGSYSGIRVGLSAAKGLCYALKIPLVTFNTLEALAVSFYQKFPKEEGIICPMIDARRMEVFTAVYNKNLSPLLIPTALELKTSTTDLFSVYNIDAFFGSGSQKFSGFFTTNPKIFERQVDISPQSLVTITNQKYKAKEFEDVSAADAMYLKAVYFAGK